MEEYKKNKTLKLERGEIANLKLKSENPFSSGSNTYEGQERNWFGYNVFQDGEEYTYFASQAVHDLMKIAGVSAEETFTLELRTERNKEGKTMSIWYLNGKNKWSYEDCLMKPAPQEEVEVAEPKFTSRDKVAEDWINQININLSNAQELLKKLKDELTVPF